MGHFRGVELDDLRLAGDRLLLRRWCPDDADRVHDVMQDASMSRFLALPDPYTRAAAIQFVTELGHEGRGDGTGLGSAVVEKGSGRVVGSASLRLAGDPEVGYWIAPDARGKGYATEATRVLANFGFAVGLRRVRVSCDVRNLASVRAALAAGFGFEGVSRDGVTGGGGIVPPRCGDLARFARLPDDSGHRVPHAFAPLPPRGLTDGVLTLRVMEPDDAQALADTDDEETLRWGFTGAPHTPQETRRTALWAGLEWLVGRIATFSMVDAASGRVAGVLNLRQAGPPQIGGIGYVVHPEFRGRGYTARALRLLVPWAFESADFARLELGAKTANVPSQRAALAAGFVPDGTRRSRLRNPDATFSDEARFALVNPRYA
ncbi:MAG TPA: GNAT family N-acetyltransferase [Jatrophihabitans sp.]|jgi:RimJ/RimL family protein N-acetyltransferase|nr:GNAT family N-acetyltransferase [Jatrophihabitans sp.]